MHLAGNGQPIGEGPSCNQCEPLIGEVDILYAPDQHEDDRDKDFQYPWKRNPLKELIHVIPV